MKMALRPKAVRGKGIGEDGPAYHLLPPHMRYGMSPGLGGMGMGMGGAPGLGGAYAAGMGLGGAGAGMGNVS